MIGDLKRQKTIPHCEFHEGADVMPMDIELSVYQSEDTIIDKEEYSSDELMAIDLIEQSTIKNALLKRDGENGADASESQTKMAKAPDSQSSIDITSSPNKL